MDSPGISLSDGGMESLYYETEFTISKKQPCDLTTISANEIMKKGNAMQHCPHLG